MFKAKAAQTILGIMWVMGLLMAGAKVAPWAPGWAQHVVCILGVVIFAGSSFGLNFIDGGNYGRSSKENRARD